jgi:hypothetical protein
VSHHYGHYQEKGESDKHYVTRRVGVAMVGIATAAEVDWYSTCLEEIDHILDGMPSEDCRRTWGRRIVQRIFAHAYRGKR